MKQIDHHIKQAGDTFNACILRGFAAEARRQGIDPDTLMKTAQIATAVPPAQTKKPAATVPPSAVPNVASRPLVAPATGVAASDNQPFVPGTKIAPYAVDRRDPAAGLFRTSTAPAAPVRGTAGGAAAHPTLAPAPVAQAPTIINRALSSEEAGAMEANRRANQAYRQRLIKSMRHQAQMRGQDPNFKSVGYDDLTRQFELEDGVLGLERGLRNVSRGFRGVGARTHHGLRRFFGAALAGEGLEQDQAVRDRWFGGGHEADLYRYDSAAYNKAFGGSEGKNVILAGPRGPQAKDVVMRGIDGRDHVIATPNVDPNYVATVDAKGNTVFADRSTLPWGGRPPPMSRRSALTANTDPQPLV